MDGRWFINRGILGWELMRREGEDVVRVANFERWPRDEEATARRVLRLLTADDQAEELRVLGADADG